MVTLTELWPLYSLSIESPRLRLRVSRDEDLPGIVEAVLAGIHDPSVMPFGTPWTDAPREQLVRNTLKHFWRLRAGVSPENWDLPLTVTLDEKVIGVQNIGARNFALTKSINTGSWLTQKYQGQGLGKEMRAAVLLFAFDHLGAEVAHSSAALWNSSSLGVSRSLGYTPGTIRRLEIRPGEVDETQDVSLAKADFIRPEWSIKMAGLGEAKAELGS